MGPSLFAVLHPLASAFLLFAVRFLEADGKELLCRPLADDKELADGKVADSSSVVANYAARCWSSDHHQCVELILTLKYRDHLGLTSRPGKDINPVQHAKFQMQENT